jgi:hypothetical protein
VRTHTSVPETPHDLSSVEETAVHDAGVLPPGPVKPALHVQAAAAVLELGALELAGHDMQLVMPVAVEYAPASQFVHAWLPLALLYVPIAHAAQMPPFGPVYPALHVQAVAAELELGEFVLAAHVRQLASDVAPAVTEYFPATQPMHAPVPLCTLYVPALHVEQDASPAPVWPSAHGHTTGVTLHEAVNPRKPVEPGNCGVGFLKRTCR